MMHADPDAEAKLLGFLEPVCQLPLSVDDARQRFGWRFRPDPDLWPNQFAVLLCQGRPLVVNGPEAKLVAREFSHARSLTVSIDAHWPDSRLALTLVLAEFALSEADLPWIAPDLGKREWAVQRQDDNGNEFLVAYGRTEADVEAIAGRFRSLGHKQWYGVRRVDR